MQMRNTLHEQRLTIQASLTAGLLLSGALYLVRGEIISRGVVIITVVATTVLLCSRRLMWRMMMYRRFESGLEVRNIIIVGTGRVGQAMRHHLDSIRHLGYSFKGYVHIPGVDAENPALAGDILGIPGSIVTTGAAIFRRRDFSLSAVRCTCGHAHRGPGTGSGCRYSCRA